MKVFLFILLFLSISLSSLPAQDEPNKKVLSQLTADENEQDYARIFVYRPWRYTSILASMRMHIDKQAKLLLPNNAKDTLYFLPGKYCLKRKIGDAFPEYLQVEAGKSYYIKLYPSLLGYRLDIVDPFLAQQELTFHSYRRTGRLKEKS